MSAVEEAIRRAREAVERAGGPVRVEAGCPGCRVLERKLADSQCAVEVLKQELAVLQRAVKPVKVEALERELAEAKVQVTELSLRGDMLEDELGFQMEMQAEYRAGLAVLVGDEAMPELIAVAGRNALMRSLSDAKTQAWKAAAVRSEHANDGCRGWVEAKPVDLAMAERMAKLRARKAEKAAGKP